MRADALVWAVHAVVVWILVRTVASLAVSVGAQSLWALAAAACVTVVVATLLTAWLTRTVRAPARRHLVRLLPVPMAGAAWTATSVLLHGAGVAQVVVAAGAWALGGVLAVLAVRAGQRARAPEDGAFGQLAAGRG